MTKVAAILFFSLVLARPANGGELQIPFEMDRDRTVILMRLTVNERPALMILDTGSTRTIVSPELANLGSSELAPSRFSSDGPGLRARGRWVEATLRLGEKVWKRRPVVAMSLEEVSRAYGARVDGLLGHDVLAEFEQVTIDFRARLIRLSTGEEGPSEP